MTHSSIRARAVFLIFAALVLACIAHRSVAAETPLGKTAPQFRLSDPAGAECSLAELRDARLVVVVFLGTECPLARLYAPRLNELAGAYSSRGVRFLGIDSNLQDTPQEIGGFVREFGISFPILKDGGNVVADKFGATRTPEAFLLDGQRMIRYHGRIDDQFDVGIKKPKAGRRDLALAIDELLDGRAVSQGELPAVGCLIGRVRQPAAGSVTYSQQISRIFQQHCLECHRKNEIGPFPMTSYEEVVGWGESIGEAVEAGRMPPWFANPKHGKFVNDARLSADEKQQIARWIADGCPEGDAQDLPPPRRFVDGWNIPQPHAVFAMSDKPFHVPAEGIVDYKHFVIDPGFTEDKWAVASEARPGNRSVVHHILVFIKGPGEQPELLRGSLLAAYAPGTPPHQLPQGWAKRIRAGSKIILQVHYTPNGKAQEDLSSVGLRFCDAKDVVQEAESSWAVNFLFAIPPQAPDYRVTSAHYFPEDRVILSLTPHMHWRGKSFRYEAVYADGRREVLLDVPRWDFNWQLDYEFAEPKIMPKGSRIVCEAHFDNSPGNPHNPDPTKSVRFGEQTWDEMMIGWFTAATLPPASAKRSQTSAAR